MSYLYAYRNIAVPANVITALIGYTTFTAGATEGLGWLFWIKVATSTILILYIHLFKSTIVFFFMNLGIGKRQLYASMFIIDIVIFILVNTLILFVR